MARVWHGGCRGLSGDKAGSNTEQRRLEDLTLSPNSTRQQLLQQQQRLFRLQEEILFYKLSCRQNILDTFTTKQWDTLRVY